MDPIQSVSQLGQPQAPYQAPVSQVPQQPQSTSFSSEPRMNTNAGNEELVKVAVVLDKESVKILQEASGVHAESIVNLGIKLFAKTNIYKEFMLKPDYMTVDKSSDDIVTLSSVTNVVQSGNGGLVNAKPSVSQAIVGNTTSTGIAPVSSW
jgi:hypothetical protein